MAHMALYRKWRPLTFEDVVEQRHIVTTLKNSIKNNTTSHAYLFCGTRGTGKTTLAKIFARAINCLQPVDGSPCNQCTTCRGILDGSIMDVIEIDAASNNGVDDVREIKEAVMYVPAITRNKVYIIDEVHMLSTGAFNALLKTLEEPPKNVVFILATTEPHKLPATILSRCQRFDFKRITLEGLTSRLKIIANDCGIPFDDSAIQLIARLSEGGMRDAISLLDQCIALGKPSITRDDVIEISGLTASETVDSFARAIVERDAQLAMHSIKTAMDEGRDLPPLCTQVIDWFRNLMLIKTGGEALNLIELGDEELRPIREAAEHISLDQTVAIIKELSETEGRLKWSENQRILLEVAAVKLCSRNSIVGEQISNESLTQIESRIQQLERKISQIQEGGKSQKEPEIVQSTSVRRNQLQKQVADVPRGESTQEPIGENIQKNMLKQWSDVIEYVRSAGKMKVYAYLLDTQCLILDDGIANVVVSSEDGLKKTVLSRNDSLEIIKDALHNITERDLVVKIVDDKVLNTFSREKDEDPTLEKIKQFATENNIPLDIQE